MRGVCAQRINACGGRCHTWCGARVARLGNDAHGSRSCPPPPRAWAMRALAVSGGGAPAAAAPPSARPRQRGRRRQVRWCAAGNGAGTDAAGVAARVAALRSGEDGGLGVVLTGGTRGLGFCLARELLAGGHRVVLCGRNAERLHAALRVLRDGCGDAAGERVDGIVADVGTAEDVDALESLARRRLGDVHLVVHNAGAASRRRAPLADLEADDILNTVNVNVAGGLLTARMALRLFREQPPADSPVYHYMSFGFSKAGASLSASALTHKVTKLSLPVLDTYILKELASDRMRDYVGVHQVSPGLLLTDLLLADTTPGVRSLVFNAIAEEPQDAARELAPLLTRVDQRASRIELLPLPAAAARMAITVPRVLLGDASAMRFFDREGNRLGSAKYKANGVEELFPGM